MRVSFLFGTRPEAIKLCPLVRAMWAHANLQPHVCVTGQHRQMLDQAVNVFDVRPDVDLGLMQPDQSLGALTARAIAACDQYLADAEPGLVLVQGDTTTVFCAALAAFYRHIPVGHVEAGLRTRNKLAPFPEEINRTLTTRLADLHFAPTALAQSNLLSEGIAEDRIFVTGNTAIDALLFALEKVKTDPPEIPGLPPFLKHDHPDIRLVLITGHRRESFGRGFENICRAIAELAATFPDVHFVYPVHLNPRVCEPVYQVLGRSSGKAKQRPLNMSDAEAPWSAQVPLQGSRETSGPRASGFANVHLIEPLGYLPFVALMNRASLILTDSGGVQEEAPSLGKPVLVMRETTERPEAIEMGSARLVGTHTRSIVQAVSQLLTDQAAYAAMAHAANPYGDGQACGRILAAIEKVFLEPACHA